MTSTSVPQLKPTQVPESRWLPTASAMPHAAEPVADLLENVTLSTATEEYAWVNTRQVLNLILKGATS